ncbi:septation protein A [Sphingomonas canadensis]|uniref:Inner membrane-spanning protein YciB n=1 Tax=Sphingomonas canadensis TaxID=1219257 RepID=A0ABW3H929_9SPHN|nr:septation protein A [Sphingomonas canadensis]MCW3837677.1 septation protein A [Sphingomonas canadensis]
MASASPRPEASPLLRMGVDIGPLLIFFVVYLFAPYGLDIQKLLAATAAFMVAMAVAMAVSWWKTRHISPMLWISGGLVLVMGSLTLWFHNEAFIKMKPTFVYLLFAIVLGYGLWARKPLLELLLGKAYPGLSARGWRLLTINWAIFFIAMAGLNELVWRTSSTAFWAGYKLWGAIPLTLVFAIANIPMLLKNGLQLEKPEDLPVPPEE